MDILIAIGILAGLGLVFGLILSAASRLFYVQTDPRMEALERALPAANCGGCGYAGCSAYAEAVLKGEAPIGACAAGGDECALEMSKIMGIEPGERKRKVAYVLCSGFKKVDSTGKEVGVKAKAQYEGFKDCVAASRIGGGGPMACSFGCVGFGSCVKACRYDAIHVVDGVAKVDKEKCVGCQACIRACPHDVITLVDYDKQVHIPCNSHAKGAVTVRGCSQGCIGCGLCKKICPEEAISIEDNLAVIHYDKCIGCGLCATVCPRKLIFSNVEPVSVEEE